MLDTAKHKLIFFWLSHGYLRRLGKRYPDYFKHIVYDTTDNLTARKIMLMRYTGEEQMKFEAIAYELNITVRRVFEHHKKVLDSMIS